jgi:hypothetical protein
VVEVDAVAKEVAATIVGQRRFGYLPVVAAVALLATTRTATGLAEFLAVLCTCNSASAFLANQKIALVTTSVVI